MAGYVGLAVLLFLPLVGLQKDFPASIHACGRPLGW
jgi:hypothetical protein